MHLGFYSGCLCLCLSIIWIFSQDERSAVREFDMVLWVPTLKSQWCKIKYVLSRRTWGSEQDEEKCMSIVHAEYTSDYTSWNGCKIPLQSAVYQMCLCRSTLVNNTWTVTALALKNSLFVTEVLKIFLFLIDTKRKYDMLLRSSTYALSQYISWQLSAQINV